MSYRIQYEVRRSGYGKWLGVGVCLVAVYWCAHSLRPVWQLAAAGEGLYDALARYVGSMILGAH